MKLQLRQEPDPSLYFLWNRETSKCAMPAEATSDNEKGPYCYLTCICVNTGKKVEGHLLNFRNGIYSRLLATVATLRQKAEILQVRMSHVYFFLHLRSI